jgi:hypothetical protein
MANFNQEDPSKQEAIRRQPHRYVEGEGRHGRYVAQQMQSTDEYPKVMDRTPPPQPHEFKGKPNAEVLLENARREFDEQQKASIVHNKAQEQEWLEAHKNDKVVSIVDRQYPKTMDKTPAPAAKDFEGLEDFRAARQQWNEQIAASIVHDREEEELWLREHAPQEAKRKKAKAS